MKTHNSLTRFTLACIFLVPMLAACGGGGGSVASAVNGDTQPPGTNQPIAPQPPPSPPPSPPPPPVDVQIPRTHHVEKLFLQQFGNTLLRAGRHVQYDLLLSDRSEIKHTERYAYTCTGRACTRTDSAETTNLSNFLDAERSEYRILRYHYEEIDPLGTGRLPEI